VHQISSSVGSSRGHQYRAVLPASGHVEAGSHHEWTEAAVWCRCPQRPSVRGGRPRRTQDPQHRGVLQPPQQGLERHASYVHAQARLRWAPRINTHRIYVHRKLGKVNWASYFKRKGYVFFHFYVREVKGQFQLRLHLNSKWFRIDWTCISCLKDRHTASDTVTMTSFDEACCAADPLFVCFFGNVCVCSEIHNAHLAPHRCLGR